MDHPDSLASLKIYSWEEIVSRELPRQIFGTGMEVLGCISGDGRWSLEVGLETDTPYSWSHHPNATSTLKHQNRTNKFDARWQKN
jgi:hypothetical protein